MSTLNEKLIVGCGYLGCRVAARWVAKGHTVHAVTRSQETAKRFRELGLTPLVADVTRPPSLAALSDLTNVDTVLFADGFDRRVSIPIQDVYVAGLSHILDALHAGIQRLIYISSTGVYGQTDGSWVDEDSPCLPTRDGGKACLAAEQLLSSSPFADRVVALRLAGIYGPERVPRKSDLLSNKSFPQDGHLNLIHVDDAASTVLAAEQLAISPCTYVVSDGNPVLRADYYKELKRLLNVTPTSGDQSATASTDGTTRNERARADKKIRADRYLADLKVELKYPDYRTGLAAIVKSE